MKRLLIGTAAISVMLGLGVLIAGSLLSWPVNTEVASPPDDLLAQLVQFPSDSGSTIRGWFVKGKENSGAVILMHGVRANRSSMVERARFLARAGYSVMLFDFQGHGESEGDHITFGYLESRDAQAAVNFVRATLPQEKIGVIGVSMGGAAVLLARPPLELDALVLEMVYPTIEQATSNRLASRLGGWASVFTPLLTWQLKPRLGIYAEELRPIASVGEMRMAKLIIAGADDKLTTLGESNSLFAHAAEPKELWIVPNAGHVDLHTVARNEYENRILNFFANHFQ